MESRIPPSTLPWRTSGSDSLAREIEPSFKSCGFLLRSRISGRDFTARSLPLSRLERSRFGSGGRLRVELKERLRSCRVLSNFAGPAEFSAVNLLKPRFRDVRRTSYPPASMAFIQMRRVMRLWGRWRRRLLIRRYASRVTGCIGWQAL
jgi:hypothetical protein